MKYIVEKQENDIVVLECFNTKEIVEIKKEELPFSVSEGDVIEYDGTSYFKNDKAKEERLKLIKEKFNNLKNNN